MVTIPDITSDLLVTLEQLYPNILPPPGTTPETLAYLQGQQSVLERLRLDQQSYTGIPL